MRISDWSSDVCSSELGSFHFLTGSSGAGKTSLLRMLYLAQRPSRGFISIFGEDVVTMARGRLPAPRRRIGVVFQDFRLVSHPSAFDNVALPLRIAGVAAPAVNDHVPELRDWWGTANRWGARPA